MGNYGGDVLTQTIELDDILDQSDISGMGDWLENLIQTQIPEKIVVTKPSEWAEKKRILPEGMNRLPGSYSWDVNPYMREILDTLHPNDPTTWIDVLKGAQITYTVGFLENGIGWVIDESPGPTLFVSGDKETAEKNLELRIDRMIQEAGIGHKIFSQVTKKHNKKSGDTKSRKEFPGGYLIGVGPNSGAKLRNDSIQYLFMDEIDAAQSELKNEGSWMAAAEKRTVSFDGIRKIVAGSTPLLLETSRIHKRFLLGTQEYYNVPCKHCKKLFVLEFFKNPTTGKGGLRWDKLANGEIDRTSVRMECPHCGGYHRNEDKSWLFSEKNGARWVATQEPKQPGRRSFHISSLYSPLGFQSWESIVDEWELAQGDVNALQVFWNTILGLPFEDRLNLPPIEKVALKYSKSGYSSGQTPPNFEPLVFVGGADVQGDRIEAQIFGFGRVKNGEKVSNKVACSVVYETFMGDTSDTGNPPWLQLEDFIGMTVNGKNIMSFCIDAGYHTETAYSFVSGYQTGVYAVMGSGNTIRKSQVFQKFPVKNFPIERADLNTDFLKSEIMNSIMKNIGENGFIPPGYIFFPEDYPESFYKGLISERKVTEKDKNGYTRHVWKTLSSARRNEELDTTVYAYAALYILAYEVCKSMDMESVDWDVFFDWCEANL